jgi:hypothetical protein
LRDGREVRFSWRTRFMLIFTDDWSTATSTGCPLDGSRKLTGNMASSISSNAIQRRNVPLEPPIRSFENVSIRMTSQAARV